MSEGGVVPEVDLEVGLEGDGGGWVERKEVR